MVIGLFHRVSLHPDLPLYFAKFYTGKVTFQLMKPRLRINAGEILIQSTALTFEYFHATSPNILDTAVPSSLWYHHKVTPLIISTWRHGGHFGRGKQVEENIPQGIQFFPHPNLSFCLTKSTWPLITCLKVAILDLLFLALFIQEPVVHNSLLARVDAIFFCRL